LRQRAPHRLLQLIDRLPLLLPLPLLRLSLLFLLLLLLIRFLLLSPLLLLLRGLGLLLGEAVLGGVMRACRRFYGIFATSTLWRRYHEALLGGPLQPVGPDPSSSSYFNSDGEGEGFYQRSAKEQEEALTLEGLPYEVGLRVCNYLSPTDLLSLALASSHTHALAADHSYPHPLILL
jgi:hypothetical protein